MSKHRPKPVDMSVPPEQRRHRHRGRAVVTPPAQMDHASSPRARRRRRDGERWLAAEAARREDDCGAESLIWDESEWGNLEIARRSLGQ